MAVYKYNKDTFYNATNGGLTYIQHVYPQSIGFEGKNKGFKIRDERTPSTRLSEKNGIWYINDFGDGDKSMNAIDLCKKVEGIESFADALKHLYGFAGINGATLERFRSDFKQEPTDLPIEYYEVHEIPPCNLTVFAPFLTAETCEEYGFFSVKGYSFVSYKKDKDGNNTTDKNLNTIVATEHYPIYCFKDEKTDFIKIYEPFAAKAHRFKSFGEKPPRYIYGWDRLFKQVDLERIKSIRKQIKNSDEENNSTSIKKLQKELDDLLLPEVIIASGGSDGLNIASLDYNVIWFNAESELINSYEYAQLQNICKAVYCLYDIDDTGIKQMVALGKQFLDIKAIWLPKKLLETNKKDFRDWITQNKSLGIKGVTHAFTGMLGMAIEFKWWRRSKTGATYRYDYASLLYFLEHHGFYMYNARTDQRKGATDYIFIRINGNIVEEVTVPTIKNFLQDWVKENHIGIQVLNTVISSPFLGERGLQSLPIKEIDFSIATEKDQLFFFKNRVVRVSADAIEFPNKKVDNYIWRNKIIDHNFHLENSPQFTIAKDINDNWDIVVHEKNNMYLNYLINGSRVHWRKELEIAFEGKSEKLKQDYHKANKFNIAGELLNDDEIQEQKEHLINKIYTIGYMMHSYKSSKKAWCVYMMDDKVSDTGDDSNGGSGKSFFISSILNNFKEVKNIEGREKEKTKDKFIFDGVTADTEFVFVDDADKWLDFGRFFSMVTGVMTINPKNSTPFELSFEASPKLAICTNYAIAKDDGSTERRLLKGVFSDYYHKQTDGYLETRGIDADFEGKELLKSDYGEKNWNLFYNFCLQCLHFYLQCEEPVFPPDGNVKKRNLIQKIGGDFMEWAKGYFDSDKLDTFLPRIDVQADFKEFSGGKVRMSVTQQKRALADFCKLQGWVFNPTDLQGTTGIIKKQYNPEGYTGTRKVIEHYYIATVATTLQPEAAPVATQGVNGAPDDDLPF